MIEKVTAANIEGIANPAFRNYARRYVDIEEGFREAVAAFGVPFAEPSGEKGREAVVGGAGVAGRARAQRREEPGLGLAVAGLRGVPAGASHRDLRDDPRLSAALLLLLQP